MLGYLGAVLIVFAVTHLLMVLALVCWPQAGLRPALVIAGCAAAGGCAAGRWMLPGRLGVAAVAAVAVVALVGVYARLTRWLHPVGVAVWVSWLLTGGTLLVWGGVFLARLEVSVVTSSLLWAAGALSVVTLPSAVVQTREGWEPLLRRRSRRDARPPVSRAGGRLPRISVHVPCHAEPPRIVIGTLEHLARLDYPDFEVLVIDNNTADPALWRPVAACCQRLGPRFRFLHVEGITGAKAGALNWALPRTCPRAELIAVVDADYQVRPQWLRETVRYFADPAMGFVQCPHAYRDYNGSALGRWANWEYAVFFATGMVSLDQCRAGLTVGTMSLIRRAALHAAGGWAQWCMTEDSELAIRIHAAGYRSVYLTEPYGRGLIPETFEGYRRQRFRWTYGPVQEFQRHWRLFLPGRLSGPSRLTGQQKLHHANHGLDVICIGLRALCFPLAAAAAVSMLAHHERVLMPGELWAASTSLLASTVILRLLVYRRAVRASIGQALGGILAFAALTHVITMASLRALARRPARWQRTDKFRQRRRGLRALACARTETLLGGTGLLAGVALGVFSGGGIVTALAVGLAVQALAYLAAPLVAIAADRSLPGTAPLHDARPVPAGLGHPVPAGPGGGLRRADRTRIRPQRADYPPVCHLWTIWLADTGWVIGAAFETTLAKAQNGDEVAFTCIFRDVQPALVRYLQVITSEADDVAGDTWVDVIDGLTRFRGDEMAFRAWLFTIARHRAVDRGRWRTRHPTTTLESGGAAERLTAPDAADAALERMGTQAALAMVASLPRDQAEIIMLRVVAGLDTRQVARITGRSPGAVRVAAHRGLRRLASLTNPAGVTR